MRASSTNFAAGLALIAGIFSASMAHAVVMDEVYSFTASGFSTVGTGTLPVSTVTGSFTVMYDTTVTGGPFTTLTVNSLNIAYVTPVTFDYGGMGNLIIGNHPSGGGFSLVEGADVFALSLSNSTTTPTFNSFQFSTTNNPNGLFRTGTGTVTMSAPQVLSAVPEPLSIALLGAGLLGLGAVRRRR